MLSFGTARSRFEAFRQHFGTAAVLITACRRGSGLWGLSNIDNAVIVVNKAPATFIITRYHSLGIDFE